MPYLDPAMQTGMVSFALSRASGALGTDGQVIPSAMESVRLTLLRRVFTLFQVRDAEDQVVRLYQRRHRIDDMHLASEEEWLRLFRGRMAMLEGE